MKRFFLTLVLCGFVGAMFAQGAKFGITAGLNTSNILFKTGSVSISPDWKPGIQGGVFMDLGLSSNLSLIPELLFAQRGAKMNDKRISTESNTLTLNYLQLPINLAYKFDVSYGQKLFPFAGIYLGYGISGTNKSGSVSDKVTFGSTVDDVKALDYGANFGVGYQFEHFIFKVQYNLGLANLSNESNFTRKNKNVAVTVGYMF